MKRHNRPAGPARERDGRPERAQGRVWIYGLHAAEAALRNPRRRAHRGLATPNAAQALADALRHAGLTPQDARPEAVAAVLPPGAVHQGIALEVEPLAPLDIDAFCADEPEQGSLVVLLDQVSDPQNVGAVLRSAAAFGASGLVLTRKCAPISSGALAKAASGALDLVPVIVVTNLAQALATLGEAGYWRVGLAGDGDRLLAEMSAADRLALVLGAEGTGLRRLTREHCDALARLPTDARMPNLNISAAAAAALYEFARRPRAA